MIYNLFDIYYFINSDGNVQNIIFLLFLSCIECVKVKSIILHLKKMWYSVLRIIFVFHGVLYYYILLSVFRKFEFY